MSNMSINHIQGKVERKTGITIQVKQLRVDSYGTIHATISKVENPTARKRVIEAVKTCFGRGTRSVVEFSAK